MGHSIRGVLLREADAAEAAAALQQPVVVALSGGVSFLPINDVQVDRLAELSAGFDLAWIETRYFGGRGDQTARFYSSGREVFNDTAERGPINRALAQLGVEADDAFAAVGLDVLRSNDRFIDED